MAYLSYDTKQYYNHQQQKVTACSEVLEVNVAANTPVNSSLLWHGMNCFNLQSK